MKKGSLIWQVLCALLLALPLAAAAESIDLTILHVNDTHGRILPGIDKTIHPTTPVGGASYLAAMIQAEREKNPDGTLVLSAGDMFQGTPISNVFKGEPVIAVMNAMHFDAMAIGNHEFDWGPDALQNLQQRARFPFLSANLLDGQGGPPAGITPLTIMERKGLKIGVIGLTTAEVAYTTKPEYVRDLTVRRPEDVLPAQIQEARRRGARLIVVLSHSGLDEDKALAQAVDGIDVIVGGHSHTAVTSALLVGSTLVAQAGSYGFYLGVIHLQIEGQLPGDRRVTGTGGLALVSAGPNDRPDPQVAAIVDEYDRKIRVKFSEVVGETSVDLITSRERETNIGNLMTDAMRAAAGTEMAFQNSGGLRTNIAQGPITLEQIYTVLPFDNALITMDLSGTTVRELLEQSVVSEYGVLQMSGVAVTYDASKPAGQRVVDARVNGQPLDPSRTYRVATNDFLAAGGDRFTGFTQGKNIAYGDNIRDIFVAYVRKNSPVSPRVEGRAASR